MRADRLLSIMLLLKAHGRMTTYALAEELEVSRRTILRDVDALSIAGVPVYTDHGPGGGVSLDENYSLSLAGLHADEIQGLLLTANAKILNEVGLGSAVEQAMLKLLAVLPSIHQQTFQQARQRILIDQLWWWQEEQPSLPHINILHNAVYDNHQLRISYKRHDGETYERIVDPYGLVAKTNTWYLIARHEGGYRSYRIGRIAGVEMLETSFERESDFDLQTYWQEQVAAFLANLERYSVTLQVHEDLIPVLESYTPGNWQILSSHADHYIVHLELESKMRARMFVLGLGPQALVIDPPDLREEVIEAAQAISNLGSPMGGQESL